MKPQILLPTPNNYGSQPYELDKNIVIVGSNGAGKTRFGVTIDSLNNQLIVHRISAQKSLSLSVSVQPVNSTAREISLFSQGHKQNDRWEHRDPITTSSNDFDIVIQLLFAKSSDRDRDYTALSRITPGQSVPDAPIDILLRIWNDILPNRPLTLVDGKISVTINSSSYAASMMSDGERVILYLISQCLVVPNNSVIIVDEPEIHLHKALVNRLWDAIEKYCPTQLFIYITHDLDFAASRHNTYKIWVKSFASHTNFDWIELPESDILPEELLLQVLGSKKNVLFVEGEKDSLDVAIYQAVYSQYLVIPRSGCLKVIEATKSIRDIQAIHHISAFGIVDGDYRTPEETAALLTHGIYTLEVAEVENLLCIEAVLRLVATQQYLDPEIILLSVTDYIIDALKKELAVQIASKTENEVKFRLNNFSKKSNSIQGILDGISSVMEGLDAEGIYSQNEVLYQDIVDNRDLSKALKYYNRKTIAGRISSIFHLHKNEYPELVMRLLNSERQSEVVSALMQYLPSLPN